MSLSSSRRRARSISVLAWERRKQREESRERDFLSSVREKSCRIWVTLRIGAVWRAGGKRPSIFVCAGSEENGVFRRGAEISALSRRPIQKYCWDWRNEERVKYAFFMVENGFTVGLQLILNVLTQKHCGRKRNEKHVEYLFCHCWKSIYPRIEINNPFARKHCGRNET